MVIDVVLVGTDGDVAHDVTAFSSEDAVIVEAVDCAVFGRFCLVEGCKRVADGVLRIQLEVEERAARHFAVFYKPIVPALLQRIDLRTGDREFVRFAGCQAGRVHVHDVLLL